jgi:hypothetical protein
MIDTAIAGRLSVCSRTDGSGRRSGDTASRVHHDAVLTYSVRGVRHAREMLELWAPIAEAAAYEVSTWGRVRRGEFEVASWPNKKGYHCVSLEVPGRTNPVIRYVHRLVLQAFRHQANQQLPFDLQGNHDDGVKANNALENLSWTTPSGNITHAWATGLMPRTRAKRSCCRFGHPVDQVYSQLDRSGNMRTWKRCGRCRRAAYRRARNRAASVRSLLDLCDSVDLVQP